LKTLDLFCCCGGASRGLADAGFEVTGVDITDDHQYPYNFIHSDVFDLPTEFISSFDFIWASPPCQHYTWSARRWKKDFPDLVDKTRQLLQNSGKPYIIENVIGAPLRKDIILCGEMFGLRVIRHRIFETNFTVFQPPHIKHRLPSNGRSYYACVAGHGGEGYSFKLEDWQKAMGIDWITNKKHLAQAIPPTYSKYLINTYPIISL
jgi:DNA (cytosine-5)-methyltransferase 1